MLKKQFIVFTPSEIAQRATMDNLRREVWVQINFGAVELIFDGRLRKFDTLCKRFQ